MTERTITYGGASSLDGFITGPNDSMDWLRWGPEVGEITGAYWKTVDTMLMGRRTWDVASKQFGGGGGGGDEGAIKTYVFSRTLKSIDAPGVTLVKDNAVDFVRSLKEKPGKGICVMGGGDFARSLFEADLIDEVGFNIHPVLLGSGTPGLLNPGRRIDLELKECRQLSNGCVYVVYTVSRAKARKKGSSRRRGA